MIMRKTLLLLLPLLAEGQVLCSLLGINCDDGVQGGVAPILGTNAGDRLGWSIALSGDGNTMAASSISGRVRVLKHDGADWLPMGTEIVSSVPMFGYSIDLSNDGTVLAVGAPGVIQEEGVQPESISGSAGSVQVFRFVNGVWQPMGSALLGEAEGDQSGSSVAISGSGNVLAVGAAFNDGSTNVILSDRGHVRVYIWNNLDNEWQKLGSDIDGENFFDRFGTAVALSDDGLTLAAGATMSDADGLFDQGQIRVFKFDDIDWKPMGQGITAGRAGGRFGNEVALSGNGRILAATSGLQEGKAQAYFYAGSSWFPLGLEFDFSGASSIDISDDGRVVAVGGPSRDGRGMVRVFQFLGVDWVQLGSDIVTADSVFGWSVALSKFGQTVAVGAPLDGGNGLPERGRVRVFEMQ